MDITILLVEDDLGHASLIKKNFKRSGFPNQIIHFPDGKQARDYIMSGIDFFQKKHIVLLDLNLPIIDGFELLEIIKKSEAAKALPVFILSSTSNQAEVQRCYGLGCNLFLNKPVEYSDLSDAIKNLGHLFKTIQC